MDPYVKQTRNTAVTNWYDIASSGRHCQPKLGLCMGKIGNSTNLWSSCVTQMYHLLYFMHNAKIWSFNTIEEVWSSMVEREEKTTTLQWGLWTVFSQGSTKKRVSWSVNRGAPRMADCVSYTAAWIQLKIKGSVLAPQSPCLLTGSHCFSRIRTCNGFIVNILFAKLEWMVHLSHTRASKIGTVSYLSHT